MKNEFDQPNIALVDDEPEILHMQQDLLEGLDASIHAFSDPVQALEFLKSEPVALVVTDWKMPHMSGLDLLFRTRSLPVPPYVIILTAYGTVDRAVQAMNAGAYNFLEKPFENGAYRNCVRDALAKSTSGSTARGSGVWMPKPGLKPIYASERMKMVFDMAVAAAQTESSVLLLGPSGAGKEVIADCIHQNSPRADGPFIKVNCGALPEHLMESELFGHEKGAFTGADRRVIGRFEQASGGTLFLDEIGDLLPNLQVKLLRTLQDKIIHRVGSGAPVKVDFRLVCATHRDLRAAVRARTFREDLYYRVNVVPIRVPALRERPEDIEPLATHFLRALGASLPSAPSGFSAEALRMLQAFAWPGNVRQLRNAVEYALVLCRGQTIGAEHLPEDVTTGDCEFEPAECGIPDSAPLIPQSEIQNSKSDLKSALEAVEAQQILAAIERHHWHITKVAQELNISRSTLYQRMEEYGIRRPE